MKKIGRNFFINIANKSYFLTNDKAIDMIVNEWNDIANMVDNINKNINTKENNFELIAKPISLSDVRKDEIETDDLLSREAIFSNAYSSENNFLSLPKGDGLENE